MRGLEVLAAVGMGLTLTASAESHCVAIRFARGTSSAMIEGVAPVDDTVCYTLAAGDSQTATIRMEKGRNTVFSIDGLVDAQDRYRFPTKRKVYTIVVGQLERTTMAEAFRMSVSVH